MRIISGVLTNRENLLLRISKNVSVKIPPRGNSAPLKRALFSENNRGTKKKTEKFSESKKSRLSKTKISVVVTLGESNVVIIPVKNVYISSGYSINVKRSSVLCRNTH